MSDILTKILEFKRHEVESARKRIPLSSLQQCDLPELRDFKSALRKPGLSVIAEVKHKSPSAGVIQPDFNPVRMAETYEQSDADAVSVLTDSEFFGGSLNYLRDIRDAVRLPLLRKDFIIDPYQIYEARCHGADAVLLIVRALSDQQLGEYLHLCRDLGLAALVEAHSAEEVESALRAGAGLIGINNRNLATFTVDLQTSVTLKDLIPQSVVTVSESGIRTDSDARLLKGAGYHAVLVGETLMRERDIKTKIRELKGNS